MDKKVATIISLVGSAVLVYLNMLKVKAGPPAPAPTPPTAPAPTPAPSITFKFQPGPTPAVPWAVKGYWETCEGTFCSPITIAMAKTDPRIPSGIVEWYRINYPDLWGR